jgi:hypothetical protein
MALFIFLFFSFKQFHFECDSMHGQILKYWDIQKLDIQIF